LLRVLLIDDHVLFRQGMKYLLADLDEDMSFSDADSCTDALRFAAEPMDLVLLDLYMPGSAGMQALGSMRDAFEASAIVVVSSEDDPRVIRRAIDLGAAGFIPKSSTPQLMIAALRLVLAGGTYLPRHVLHDVSPAPVQPASDATGPGRAGEVLSGRQLEVLMKVVQGKANKVIAREMQLSEGTVKAHLSSAFRTLGVQSRTEAVYMAAKVGLTQAPAGS
jgi:DNA-binding NarL/FixJ family response regulator